MLRRTASTLGLASVLPLLLVGVAHADPERCAVIDGTGRCLVAAADPGRPGGPKSKSHRSVPTTSSADNDRSSVPSRPPIVALPIGVGDSAGFTVGQMPDLSRLAINAPPAGRRVNPAELAQEAIKLMTLRAPSVQTSTSGTGFVGVPVWLWIERGVQSTGPVSATAVAGAARVVATGQLTGVEWSMGPPGAEVRCAGPGTPWIGQAGPSPDCGYVYEQRSLPGRTGGTGRWSITATGVWQVDWAGNSNGAPVAGTQTVRLSSQTALAVGEIQVLVDGGGS